MQEPGTRNVSRGSFHRSFEFGIKELKAVLQAARNGGFSGHSGNQPRAAACRRLMVNRDRDHRWREVVQRFSLSSLKGGRYFGLVDRHLICRFFWLWSDIRRAAQPNGVVRRFEGIWRVSVEMIDTVNLKNKVETSERSILVL
jgi:hypothetical protein